MQVLPPDQLALKLEFIQQYVSAANPADGSKLDANANAIAIQHIKLENEGWERDYEVAAPAEVTFTEPQ